MRTLVSLYLTIFLAACPVIGQVKQKKTLTKEDYHLWHQLIPHQISCEGNWVSYLHHYESNLDTLFVANTKRQQVYSFPKGSNSIFISQSHFICQTADNFLNITNLKNGFKIRLADITTYTVAQHNRLVIMHEVKNNHRELMIVDLKGNVAATFPDITEWKINGTKTQIAFTRKGTEKNTVFIIDMENSYSLTTLLTAKQELYSLLWAKSGTGLVFLQHRERINGVDSRGSIHYYDTTIKRLYSYSPANDKQLPQNFSLAENYATTTSVSDDGKRVFFGIEETEVRPLPNPVTVEVWNTADKSIYPAKIESDGWRKRAMIGVWYIKTGICRQVNDSSLPHMTLNGNQEYAITSDPLAYEPQFKYYSDRDFYITELKTGNKKLFLKGASGDVGDLLSSPSGKYIIYLKDKNWWSYDVATEAHMNLTGAIKLLHTDDANINSGDGMTLRSPGFTTNDAEVLIYDTYDIWKVRTDGSSFQRLTHGRESKTIYRILPQSAVKPYRYSYDGNGGALFDLSKPLYLEAINEDTQDTGIFLWTTAKGERPLVYKDKIINNFLLADDNKSFVYMEQNFDLAPKLVKADIFTNKNSIVCKSNIQQDTYYWGKSELITYAAMGQTLQGVLLYPAAYDPKMKYPMIVHVYQKQSQDLHLYVNPSLADYRGFNTTNFTLQNYFVFLPGIVYTIGDTGRSATECVNAAVQNIIALDIIDKNKIGLIGHSYGGFEANFIATQKNPFKTIVSGAGYSDLAADYLYIARDFRTPDYSRYEEGQMRMGKSLFEDTKRYHNNSPILLAEGVTLPLLSWTGAKDVHVDANHSFKFHMALRRLKKENILLVYPEETHVLMNVRNQVDLSTKINEWFDYYLKGNERKEWMEANFTGL